MTLEIPNLTLQIQVSIPSHQWCIVIISQCGIPCGMEWSRRGRMIINKNSFAAQVSKTSRALNFPPPSQCICMAANPWDLRWIWQIVVRCRLPLNSCWASPASVEGVLMSQSGSPTVIFQSTIASGQQNLQHHGISWPKEWCLMLDMSIIFLPT